MKTKFDSIVKVKKNEVEKIERNINKLNSSIKMLEDKIITLNNKLSSFTFPKNGNFSEFNQYKILQNSLIEEIENFKNQLNILNNRKKELFQEYKKANIEYEKMKYLQNEEIKRVLKKKKKKEQLEMDEIAILLRENSGFK